MALVVRPVAAALFALGCLTAAPVAAQSLSAFGTDNKGKAIGELTDAQILEALEQDGRVSMSGAFFETDSAALSDSAGEVLFKLANAMKEMPNTRLAVIGHTDATGKFDYNLELSQKRADSVAEVLLGDPNNIDRERLVAVGVGPIAPVASNESEEGRGLNRRVSFVLIE